MQPVPLVRHPVLKELQSKSVVEVLSSAQTLSVHAVVEVALTTL